MKANMLIFVLLFFIMAITRLFSFSTHNTTISRTTDRTTAFIGDSILVTVIFNNFETQALHGYYYVEYLPQGLTAQIRSIEINGLPVSNYMLETGADGEVHPACSALRFILETPVAFNENNPIPASGQLKIVYAISTNIASKYELTEFHWVGYYETDHAAFGHSEDSDSLNIRFNPFTSINDQTNTVQGFFLEQNYPNPFNPETSIVYSLLKTGHVSLTICDLQGRTIRELINSERLEAGKYTARWNGTDQKNQIAPSGLYIGKLQVNGLVKTRKMLLLK